MMTPRRRELMLKVVDDHPAVPAWLYQLQLHVKETDKVLAWLIQERLTGQRFINWLKDVHGCSILTASSHILNEIRRSRPIKLVNNSK